jgi:oxygen-independent coproporphyrinogen-3 oxidase
MRPERIALFGYAHVPHMIPRQRRIDDSALPGAELRFRQAELGHEMLGKAGYEAIGFDHYAQPADPLAQAAHSRSLRRNFQGFTDDQAGVLIGLGASSISQFPHLLVQNEKNSGRYRMSIDAGLFASERGVARDLSDRLRGRVIEQLLCDGAADVGPVCGEEERERLQRFIDCDLVSFDGGILRIADEGRPYARVIAAIFDTYRQPSARRFSNAI